MPLPDHWSEQCHRRTHGDAATDAAQDRADKAVVRDVARAKELRSRIRTFLLEIDFQFETVFPARGYGMDDITDLLTAIRDGIDLNEYRTRAEAVAIDKAMGGDL